LDWQQDVTVMQAKQLTTVAATVGNGWSNSWQRLQQRFKLAITLLLHPRNGLFSRTTWVSRHQKGKTSLDLNEARDDGVWGCSGISWTICQQLHLASDR